MRSMSPVATRAGAPAARRETPSSTRRSLAPAHTLTPLARGVVVAAAAHSAFVVAVGALCRRRTSAHMRCSTVLLGCFPSALLLLLLLRRATPAAAPSTAATAGVVGLQQALSRAAFDWEPELYAELGAAGPAAFDPALRSPCLTQPPAAKKGGRRCVPGAFLIGNWQSNAKGLGAIVGTHPDIVSVGNDKCYGAWTDDAGGRRWLSKGMAKVAFDPERQLVAALGCVTALNFYPGFAGRYHKFWEREYWPCKAACTKDKECSRTYYDASNPRGMWMCKGRALAAHDRAVSLAVSPAGAGGANNLTLTPPYLMRAFYGSRVKLIATVRSPVDRLRHAFYSHVHYRRRYGEGASGLHAYATEQAAGWRACVASYSAKRCAIHFEQLGPAQNDVFFHSDQLIRGLYAPFVRDWLAAFPEGVPPPSLSHAAASNAAPFRRPPPRGASRARCTADTAAHPARRRGCSSCGPRTLSTSARRCSTASGGTSGSSRWTSISRCRPSSRARSSGCPPTTTRGRARWARSRSARPRCSRRCTRRTTSSCETCSPPTATRAAAAAISSRRATTSCGPTRSIEYCP